MLKFNHNLNGKNQVIEVSGLELTEEMTLYSILVRDKLIGQITIYKPCVQLESIFHEAIMQGAHMAIVYSDDQVRLIDTINNNTILLQLLSNPNFIQSANLFFHKTEFNL